MRAYSEDLRNKIVAAIQRGMPKSQAARLFDVSLSSVKRYARTARKGESLTPKKSPGRPRKVDEKARALLEKDVEERPTATISQSRRFLEHITATTLSDSTVRRLMKRLGFSERFKRELPEERVIRCEEVVDSSGCALSVMVSASRRRSTSRSRARTSTHSTTNGVRGNFERGCWRAREPEHRGDSHPLWLG